MSRPCYALWILLLAFAGSMMAVQAAQGQTSLEARLGNIRHRICPLLGDEMLSCGFGPLATPLGLSEVQPGCGLSETLGPGIRNKYRCNLGSASATVNETASTAPDREQLLSGHDPIYDAIVYGEASAPQPAAARAPESLGFVFFIPDPAPTYSVVTRAPCTELCMQEVFEQAWFDACWPVPAARHPRVPLAASIRPTLDAEPDSLADYYAMYGGAEVAVSAPSVSRKSGALAALLALPGQFLDAVRDSSFVAARRCELEDLSYRLRHAGREFAWDLRIRSGFQRWIAEPRPAVSDLARPAAEPAAPQVRESAEQLGRTLLRSVARTLDRTGRALQNASHELNNLLENETTEVSTQPAWID